MLPIAIAAFAAGSALQAFSSYRQAQIENIKADYSAAAARYNAGLALMEGDYALDAARKEEKRTREQVDQFIGAQRARMGSSGFSVESASYEDIIDSTAVMGELDALAIRHEGKLAKWRAGEEAKMLEYQADIYETTKVSPGMALTTSLLTSGAQAGATFGGKG